MVKAYQLQALLRMRKKKYAAARKILERAQAVDAGNPTTIAFMTAVKSQIHEEEKDLTAGELKNKRLQEDSQEEPRSPLSGDDVIIPKSTFRDYNPATLAVIQILIGFLVGAALIFFVVVPAKTNAVRNETSAQQAELKSQLSAVMEENAQLSADLAGLRTEAENARSAAENSDNAQDASDVQTPAASDKDVEILMEAYEKYQDGDVAGCGNLMYELQNPERFNGANKAVYDTIAYTKDVVPDYWYNNAVKLFEDNNFEAALSEFTRVYDVANTTGESLYYMGLCYYNLDRNEEAAARFREYIDTFPEGPHVSECDWLLSQI